MTQQSDDLHAAFADASLTVPVVYGVQSTRGVLTITDEPLSANEGEDVVGELTTVEIITGTLTGIAFSAAITVDGAAYTIDDYRRIEDGKLQRLYLATAVTALEP